MINFIENNYYLPATKKDLNGGIFSLSCFLLSSHTVVIVLSLCLSHSLSLTYSLPLSLAFSQLLFLTNSLSLSLSLCIYKSSSLLLWISITLFLLTRATPEFFHGPGKHLSPIWKFILITVIDMGQIMCFICSRYCIIFLFELNSPPYWLIWCTPLLCWKIKLVSNDGEREVLSTVHQEHLGLSIILPTYYLIHFFFSSLICKRIRKKFSFVMQICRWACRSLIDDPSPQRNAYI